MRLSLGLDRSRRPCRWWCPTGNKSKRCFAMEIFIIRENGRGELVHVRDRKEGNRQSLDFVYADIAKEGSFFFS